MAQFPLYYIIYNIYIICILYLLYYMHTFVLHNYTHVFFYC